MYQVCLVEDNPKVISILKEHLEQEFAAVVHCFNDADQAIDFIKNGIPIDLIVVRNILQEGEQLAAHKVYSYLYDRDTRIPAICLGEVDFAVKEFEGLPSRFRLEEFTRLAIRLLQIDKDKLFILRMPDYIGFPLSHFYLLDKAPCELFLKLARKGGDQYIKRLLPNDEIDNDVLSRYQTQGIIELHVHKEDWTGLMKAFLESGSKWTKSDFDHQGLSHFYTVFRDMARLGQKHSLTGDFLRHFHQSIRPVVQASLNLYESINDILKSQSSFEYRHAILQMIFGVRAIEEFEWHEKESDQEVQQLLIDQLMYCCMIKDLYLETKEEFFLNTLERFKQNPYGFSAETLERIERHAHTGAVFSQGISRLPLGVDVLVRQHHGSENGMGFKSHMAVGISPLSSFLIIIDELALEILEMKAQDITPTNMSLLMTKVRGLYPSNTYTKILAGLEKSITSQR